MLQVEIHLCDCYLSKFGDKDEFLLCMRSAESLVLTLCQGQSSI